MNDAPALPASIAGDAGAPLPSRYEAARTAIAECERIDECKTWSDKAAAMASYARQAKDDSLRVMAIRIQARAQRRCGELLKQIPRADEATRYGRAAAGPPVSRTKMAADAGLSARQRKTALRVANVPAATFEAKVESPKPPSVTQLASLGTAPRSATVRRSPWQDIECAETRAACETLDRFSRFCGESDPVGISRAVNAAEARAVRRCLSIVGEWLNALAAALDVTEE